MRALEDVPSVFAPTSGKTFRMRVTRTALSPASEKYFPTGLWLLQSCVAKKLAPCLATKILAVTTTMFGETAVRTFVCIQKGLLQNLQQPFFLQFETVRRG